MKNPWMIVFALVASMLLLGGVCSAGFLAGMVYERQPFLGNNQSNRPDTSSETPAETDELFAPLRETWQLLNLYYVDQPLDSTKLIQGAIRGMMEALGDEHSTYMDPQEYEDANSRMSQEYQGIGAWVNTEGEYLTIVEPMPGSPAEKAGLLPGDQIIAIDGEDMTGILPEMARQRVLGPKDTTVVLTIRRESVEEPFDVSIQRASIRVANIETEMLDGNIAYVRVREFGQLTGTELRASLTEILQQNPSGLILDLRNNPGGYLTSAVQVTSEFVESGVVLYEEYGDGTRDTHNVISGGVATDIPMVVLVNEFSASASELVAGALQDYGRATIVGVTTFGKGTVQRWIPLQDDQGAVRVTIARWLSPNERNIHKEGITPDVVVERSEEDFRAGLDPQLDKAIEILKSK